MTAPLNEEPRMQRLKQRTCLAVSQFAVGLGSQNSGALRFVLDFVSREYVRQGLLCGLWRRLLGMKKVAADVPQAVRACPAIWQRYVRHAAQSYGRVASVRHRILAR